MNDLNITQVSHDCLVVEEPGRKYRYLADIDLHRKVEVEAWIEDGDPQVHLKFKCIPRRGWLGRIKDTWLTWRGFDTTYVINVSARVVEEIKKEVLNARPRL